MNNKKLDAQYVLRKPLGYAIILLLAIMPYFVVDYQTCFLTVQASNPDASLLNFIRHVLIEKFSQSLALTLIIFISIYALSKQFEIKQKHDFKSEVINYLKHSIWILVTGFIIYALIDIILLSLFPSHHPAIEGDLVTDLLVFNFLYFTFLYYSLIVITIAKSIIHAPLQKLEVTDGKGKCIIDLHNIDWVVKENGIYELRSIEKVFRTDYSINHFEKILDANKYVKINRAAIVRKDLICGYNYWEHDKYILRVGKDVEKEFVVSRQRMKLIRTLLRHSA